MNAIFKQGSPITVRRVFLERSFVFFTAIDGQCECGAAFWTTNPDIGYNAPTFLLPSRKLGSYEVNHVFR